MWYPEGGKRSAYRSRSRESPTQPAARWSLALPLTGTLTDLRWLGRQPTRLRAGWEAFLARLRRTRISFRRPVGVVRQNTSVLDLYHRLVRAYAGLGWPAGVALAVVVPTLTFLFGIAVVLWLPADYFVRDERNSPAPAAPGFWQRHRVVRVTVRILKNALGWFMLPLGIFMALPLVPGPGLVFILIGISLLDFPGKRHLEERLLAYPPVLHAVNRMRQRFGRSSVLVHPHGSASGGRRSPGDKPI